MSNQPSLETLVYFQELVGNIVHQSGSLFRPQGCSPFNSYRLRSLQSQHHCRTWEQPPEIEKNVPSPVEKAPPDKSPDILEENCTRDAVQAPSPGQYFDVLRRISVLMAGAIFGIILLGLCCR